MRATGTAATTIGLVAGLGVGFVLGPGDARHGDAVIAVLEPVGTLWVNAIRMTVVPLVVPLVIVGVVGAGDPGRVGRLGVRALALALLLLASLATVTAFVGPWVFSGLTVDPRAVAALRASASAAMPSAETLTLRSWLLSLVPASPVRAAADGALLPLLVFTLAYAFALARADAATRDQQLRFFRGVSDVMSRLVRWVLALAPIGVFALAVGLGARFGTSAVGAIGFYIAVLVVSHALAAPLLYALAITARGVSLRAFARAALPAQAVAFSTRSSLASLPALVDGARRHLRLGPEATGFVLPLAVSTFKLTAAIYWLVGALFVGRLYGIELDATQIATVAIASVFFSAATPGIPSGGLLIQAPLFAAVGLPLEGLGILIAIDTIPDMFKTALNVTADLTVATLVVRPAAAEERSEERVAVTA